MLEVRVPRLVGRSRAAPGDEGAGLSRYADVGRREHRQEVGWQRAARSPVLKADDGARVGILLDKTRFGLICHNPACVIALESEPRDVSAPIVMSFDAHAVSLPRAPERHDPRGEIITAVRMAVRHDEAPDPDRPVSGAGVCAPLAVVLEHGGLDIDAGKPKESHLGKGMLRPNDQPRSPRHLRTLRRPSDVAAAKQPTMKLMARLRALTKGDDVNLLRRTVLGATGPDVARDMLKGAVQEGELQLETFDPIFQAPAVQVLPLAVFV